MQELTEREGHTAVAESIRVVLTRLRQEISGGHFDGKSLDLALGGLPAAVERQLRQSLNYSLLPLINATGVILHTNLGRAPLAAVALDHVRATASAYSNLEFELSTGERGKRDVHVDRLFRKLLDDALPSFARLDPSAPLGAGSRGQPSPRGPEQAISTIVVNNNAAAVLLALNSLAPRGEPIVSPGDLVEIATSLPLPDVMSNARATPPEDRTTHRTPIAPYSRATNQPTPP